MLLSNGNIYLNGRIMGFSDEEIKERVPLVESFADIGDFIHQPVKMYSSGMFARLAFAVSVNVDPDVLIQMGSDFLPLPVVRLPYRKERIISL